MFTRANIGPQYEQDESSVPLTFKIHFNTVLPFTLTMTKWYLSFRSSDKNSVCISHATTQTTGRVIVLHFINTKNI